MNRRQNEIQHFSQLEHIWWGAKTPAGIRRYDNKADRMNRLCKIKKTSKILEIGCGDGEFTRRILSTGAEITATDITPEVIKRGRKKISDPRLKFAVDNCERMKFKSSSFDLVCGISILHHVDTRKTLAECYRVLKPKGELFFTEPNLLNPNIFIGLNTPGLRQKMEYSPDETALIRWQLQKMLQEVGFTTVKVSNYDFLHPLTPQGLISAVEKVSNVLERTPLVKEISGSLIVYASK